MKLKNVWFFLFLFKNICKKLLNFYPTAIIVYEIIFWYQLTTSIETIEQRDLRFKSLKTVFEH